VFDACRTNDVASLCRLLSFFSADAVLKANNNGWTGLHFAACYGHLAIVELLLESGAEIDIANDCYGGTPLMQAAAHGNVDATQRLLEAGANLKIEDRFNKTALSMALLENHNAVLTPTPAVSPTPAVT
jgi:ankyrin repeat protein